MNSSNIIADIQTRHRLSQARIATLVGCGQVTISDLSAGRNSEPRYRLGAALLELQEKGPQGPAESAQPAADAVAGQGA